MSSRFDLETEVRDLAARRDIHDALCRYLRGQNYPAAREDQRTSA